jgi:uncharacterized membrane-anchored protein
MQFKIGIGLIVISSLLYASLLAVPFLKISVTAKLSITPVIVIIGEILFWVGGILVGKEVIMKYRKNINPKNWFKKDEPPVP